MPADPDCMDEDTWSRIDAAGEGQHPVEHNGYSGWCVGKKAAGRKLDGRTWDELPNQEAARA